MGMLGGRRFLFVGLPPLGCLPIVRTLLGTGSQSCDDDLNQLALSFNSKLLQLLNIINSQSQIRIRYVDAYAILNDATRDPNKFGTVLLRTAAPVNSLLANC
jgi:phospholipase/lecithinase/hemolysin